MDNMVPDTSYRILLFAVNPKGRSEPVLIDGVNFKGVAKYTGNADKLDLELSPLLAALAVAAAALFVFSCCVLVALYRRNSNKYTSPASPDEQKLDRQISKFSVTARMANGQMTTTTVGGSPNNFSLPTSQIESTRQLRSPLGTGSPSVLGIRAGGDGGTSCLSIGKFNDSQPIMGQSELEEVDPDVIPNQYGKAGYVTLPWTSSFNSFAVPDCFPERRPTKLPVSMQLFTKGTSGDFAMRAEEDRLSLGSFQTSNSEVHYTFQASKPIVSLSVR